MYAHNTNYCFLLNNDMVDTYNIIIKDRTSKSLMAINLNLRDINNCLIY